MRVAVVIAGVIGGVIGIIATLLALGIGGLGSAVGAQGASTMFQLGWTTFFAQPKPEFKLGFKALAEQIPDIVGEPLENEHWGANGDSLQQTSKGLMVWRKANNSTAFTSGYKTWVNGPFGVMERYNEDRFEWENETPLSTPAPAVPIPATPVPAPTPRPSPTPAPPKITYTNPNVIQGQGSVADTVWVLGEVRNEGTTPAYDVRVSGRLLSASGSVAGADEDTIPYVGPGDAVAYSVAVRSPAPYVEAEISVGPKAQPSTLAYMKGKVSNAGLRKVTNSFSFAGIATNGNNIPIRNMQVRTWFLDAQNKVVDVTTNYFGGDLAPGESTSFDKQSHSTQHNPKVGTITQGKAYVWGYD